MHPPTTRAAITAQLVALGVSRGGVLLVHTSLRALGPIEEGPHGLIAALTDALGPEGTLVMPTMTDGEKPFDPKTTPTVDMGITAETFWRLPGVLRSTHPGGSFAARGPLEARICAEQPLAPPHGPNSPPGRVHELDGQVLLLGVQHSESTTLHVAEAIANVPYSISYPTAVRAGDSVKTVMIPETDHCCRGFCKLDAWLDAEGLQREGPVGYGHAKLARSRDIVRVATARLARDPLVFLCEAAIGCEECDAARASIT